MVTKAVGDWFGPGGIADRYIRLNGYPFLDSEDHVFGVPGNNIGVMLTLERRSTHVTFITVSHVMQDNVTVMTASGMTFADIGRAH